MSPLPIGIMCNNVNIDSYSLLSYLYNAGADYIQFMILELLPPFFLEDILVRDLTK